MSGDFRKKTSGIFITVFIGFIIVSFVISGYNGDKAGSSTIGTVGEYKIDYSEFQNVYDRQIAFYRQLGKELTAKDIEQLKLKENIVKQLVQQKLVLVFADKIGVVPSQAEIRDSIANFSQGDQKIFQTNGVFNVELYKKLLAGARISPAQFEKQNETLIKNKIILDFIAKVPLSKSFALEIEELKKKKIKTDSIQINKKGMEAFVTITDKEIADYLAKNQNQVKAKFDIEKSRLTKPAEAKVKHILIYKDEKDLDKILADLTKNLTPKNFAKMAEKYNRGPDEKKNGGDLGWISKGRTIPEFDIAFSLKPGTISPMINSQYGSHFLLVEDQKPEFVPTFDLMKNSLAKEILQSQKPFEVEKIVQNISKEIGELLKDDKIAKVEEIAKKYNLTLQKGIVINQLDGAAGKINIPSESLVKIFADNLDKPKTFVFANPTGVSLIRAAWDTSKSESKDANSAQNIGSELAQIFAGDITNSVKNDVKVSTYKFNE
jgi:peptidyl-prolyl cis-trans isomerase D